MTLRRFLIGSFGVLLGVLYACSSEAPDSSSPYIESASPQREDGSYAVELLHQHDAVVVMDAYEEAAALPSDQGRSDRAQHTDHASAGAPFISAEERQHIEHVTLPHRMVAPDVPLLAPASRRPVAQGDVNDPRARYDESVQLLRGDPEVLRTQILTHTPPRHVESSEE